MEGIYLIFVAVLFLLAFSDLMVGVANDAVNFLNSAVGAKAASFKTVLIVASVGVLVGATFSSGLMEIARKGLFFPGQFSFNEVIIIFLAVMITDVILLDMFNTFGLPTSTTVSIVFELLGASVAIAVIKITGSEQTMQDIGQYINSAKALAIITGILVSVAIAFSVGALVQYITRILFTFNLRFNLKYFGALWGGLAITGITYFMLIKGAKGASFITPETLKYINANTGLILLASFAGWTLILQILMLLFRLNVLKVIVLAGTFALAMAFAGNDLVNFIGVPLAGLKALQLFNAAPGADPNTFLMTGLAEDVKTETWMLLIAGVVMAITLWTSKKARSVIETSVDLSRQGEGAERFNSSILSRNLVRGAMNVSSAISRFLPDKVNLWIEKRFNPPDETTITQMPEGAAFDMLRASVNLVVASMLIALGTSLKLPLSTTYVTFMVAMGTSLSDRAWGRESAVYRITGVLSVIGGWFFTALAAFTVSLIAATILYFGGLVAIFTLLFLAGFLIYRTHRIHLRRTNERKADQAIDALPDELSTETIIVRCSLTIQQVLEQSLAIFKETLMGLMDEDRKVLKNAKSGSEALNVSTKRLKNQISKTLSHLREDSVESGHYYVQAIDYLREINHCISFITMPSFEHVENNHRPMIPVQIEELSRLNGEISLLFGEVMNMLKKQNYADFDMIVARQQNIQRIIEETRKKQVKRIKNSETGTRNSILYLNILAEMKNLTLYTLNLLKSSRDFEQAAHTVNKNPE
ncbi:inorganic phosphate transporter [Lentimicrobium sp.]|uniref:inorganic phosphate transporter n=1 Tax=Lentimicrobium sp. TaxID=2034841 RepID=UPI0025E284A3|nr:inorganic phosphate transporter [Lentimicrobium sp.]MCO5255492.1 inorganic phosphate transporter [Lentimicrobium sp.]MCO5263099.1 inorganic phosphate transporter [Lentimicrobium sp.]HOP13828.1 inorganic phosphate transporter [Lentimicrobium sp.]HPJ63149.1 inorganic phosphate transporter [Lentimicrobium sp.]HPR25184.1 inorganic phosphate transporter [Lentimicrobium sp.]